MIVIIFSRISFSIFMIRHFKCAFIMTLSYSYERKHNICTLISNSELYMGKIKRLLKLGYFYDIILDLFTTFRINLQIFYINIWIFFYTRNLGAIIFNAFLRTFLNPALSPSPKNSALV